jgi:hypothetical protein
MLVTGRDRAERDDVHAAIHRAQLDRPDGQLLHHARQARHLHHVADRHRVLEQQEGAGDDVAHQRLRPEADREPTTPAPAIRGATFTPISVSTFSATKTMMVPDSRVRSIGSSVRTRALRAACASRDSFVRWRWMAALVSSQTAVATTMVSVIDTSEPSSRAPSCRGGTSRRLEAPGIPAGTGSGT